MPFRARLTQVALHSLRLSATDEHLPRIAFVAVPADTILVLLPRGRGTRAEQTSVIRICQVPV
jgi:hypothetical protein